MGLKLFHITEFAESLISPASQRESSHPAVLLVLASLWLAVAGNLPLWRELARQPMDRLPLVWIGLCFALLTAGALGALLSTLNWRWLLKLAITLLLWLAALNTVLLWNQQDFLHLTWGMPYWQTTLARLRALSGWHLLLGLGLLAGLPTLVLWRTRMQRIPLPRQLPQNLLLFFACTGLLVIVWFSGRSALLPLLQDQPRWIELLSPLNTLLSLVR